jgi:hypothetical protein
VRTSLYILYINIDLDAGKFIMKECFER